MNAFGIPSFSGYMLGSSDVMMIFSVFGKFKGKPVSLINVTFIGGYRNN